ncbi:MAG: molybdopterin molybdotransferase MoeA [Candidatus Bathycorpusculaceae bacterium]
MGKHLTRLKGFQKLTSTDDALRTWFNALSFKKPKAANISLDKALNRVLAEDIVAEEDLPRFDRSAVDGYALKAESTIGASQLKPKILQLTDADEIDPQQVKQVWTGNRIPKGADAVVMLEETKRTADKIELWASLTPGENVSRRGEDVKKGDTAIKSGTRLKPQHLALLAALGRSEAKVFEKPRIAILSTGNELVEAGSELRENGIFETNRIMLSALCHELGSETLDLGIAKDDINEIITRLRFGLENGDAIITSGGTSVGALDLVPEAVNAIGKPGVIVHGVAMRPAMPTALAAVEGKPIVALSGNPVAAIIGFEVFARPLIFRMLGLEKEEHRPMIKAKMTRKVTAALGRKTFVRVWVSRKDDEFFAEPVSARGSGIISTMTKANGYVVVPKNREGVAEGDNVTVYLFNDKQAVD